MHGRLSVNSKVSFSFQLAGSDGFVLPAVAPGFLGPAQFTVFAVEDGGWHGMAPGCWLLRGRGTEARAERHGTADAADGVVRFAGWLRKRAEG